MNKIKWVSEGTKKYPCYDADIGCYCLSCIPEVTSSFNREFKPYISGWYGIIYSGCGCVYMTKRRGSKELAQKDVEKMVIKHLLGSGFLMIKELKKAGLLEQVLSEVGVEI